MGQEVKNLLRAQSQYGLMGSSAKTEKKNFQGSPEHFLHKNTIWDRTPPPPTHQLQSTCMQAGSRVPNLQTEFNYLNSFKSYGIFSDFIVPVVPTSSLCRPRVVPVIPMSSPHCPHSPQKVPMWSPRSVVSVVSTCCPRGLCGLHMLSLWSPHHPRCPCVIPVSPLSSPCHPHSPHVVPMWSPRSVVFTCCPHGPHVVPVVPTSSLSSSYCLEGPHIIPNPPDTDSTHPLGGGGPRISKNTIRFELIEIF